MRVVSLQHDGILAIVGSDGGGERQSSGGHGQGEETGEHLRGWHVRSARLAKRETVNGVCEAANTLFGRKIRHSNLQTTQHRDSRTVTLFARSRLLQGTEG